MPSFPLPIPIRGLNTEDPKLTLDSGYARELTNYYITNGILRMRPACRIDTTNTTGSIYTFSHVVESGTDFIVLDNNGQYYNMTTGSSLGNVGASALGTRRHYCKHISLDLIIGCGAPRNRESPFTAWTITPLFITQANITTAVSYKGRLFFSDGDTIEYTSVGQVTGAIPTGNNFNVNEFAEGGSVIRLFSLSLQNNSTMDNVLVVVHDNGIVLAFIGDFPTSSAWRLLGKWQMPAPNYTGFCEVDGDVWVTTEEYSYWIQDLFVGGTVAAYANRPTQNIETLWRASELGTATAAYAVYMPQHDIILCHEFGYADDIDHVFDYDSDGMFLVYHRRYQAWALWPTSPLLYPFVLYTNSSGQEKLAGLDGSRNIKQLEDTYCVDEHISSTLIAIESVWKTPYFTQRSGQGMHVKGYDVTYKNTLDGYFARAQSIFDYSDYNLPFGFFQQSNYTGTETTPFRQSLNAGVSMPTNVADYYTTYLGSGGSGSIASVMLSQLNTSTASPIHNHEILGAMVHSESGGINK